MKCADIAVIDNQVDTLDTTVKAQLKTLFLCIINTVLDDENSSVPRIQIVGQATPRIGIENDGR